MRVSGFMVPAERVVTVTPTDTVRNVMDLMLAKHIGAIVVIEHHRVGDDEENSNEAVRPIPVGIITKSDIVQAYHDNIQIDDPCTSIMGNQQRRELVTCTPNTDRDKVARILEHNHNHHVIVVDEETQSQFVGLVSSWDISAECARDDRAWPYLRGEDGTIPIVETKRSEPTTPPPTPYDPHKPTTIINHPHDEFTTYMDDLDLAGIQ